MYDINWKEDTKQDRIRNDERRRCISFVRRLIKPGETIISLPLGTDYLKKTLSDNPYCELECGINSDEYDSNFLTQCKNFHAPVFVITTSFDKETLLKMIGTASFVQSHIVISSILEKCSVNDVIDIFG